MGGQITSSGGQSHWVQPSGAGPSSQGAVQLERARQSGSRKPSQMQPGHEPSALGIAWQALRAQSRQAVEEGMGGLLAAGGALGL